MWLHFISLLSSAGICRTSAAHRHSDTSHFQYIYIRFIRFKSLPPSPELLVGSRVKLTRHMWWWVVLFFFLVWTFICSSNVYRARRLFINASRSPPSDATTVCEQHQRNRWGLKGHFGVLCVACLKWRLKVFCLLSWTENCTWRQEKHFLWFWSWRGFVSFFRKTFWSGHVTNDVLHTESCLLIAFKPFLFLILAQNWAMRHNLKPKPWLPFCPLWLSIPVGGRCGQRRLAIGQRCEFLCQSFTNIHTD